MGMTAAISSAIVDGTPWSRSMMDDRAARAHGHGRATVNMCRRSRANRRLSRCWVHL
jgi:hypothetical protein